MKPKQELIADAIETLIYALEESGGQFLVEIDGKEYTSGGFSKTKNEIIIHAFNE